MAPRLRADAELVRRKLARSREHAAELIKTGRVTCNGMPVKKPASIIDPNAALVVEELEEYKWASRGAHKLLGALDAFGPQGLTVAGKRCLDAGASTGGFTDVLLAHDAAHVIGVDVGYGQMVWRLQSDPRVTVLDRTNVRSINADTLGGTSRPRRVGPLLYLPYTGPGGLIGLLHPGRTDDADGKTTVRGRQAQRRGRGSSARPCTAPCCNMPSRAESSRAWNGYSGHCSVSTSRTIGERRIFPLD